MSAFVGQGKLRATAASLTALALAGCLHRSAVEGRSFATPEQFRRQQAAARAATRAKLGRWWALFDDARLDQLIERAFRHNCDLEATRARIAQARARVMGATAGWYPTIAGGAQAQRSRIALNLPQGAQQVEASVFQLSLSASYELDLWGKVRYARAAAKHQLESSREDLRAAYVTVAANVADTYYLLVQQREQRELVVKTIENRAKQTELVKRRYQAGVAHPSDLYQAQQALAQARARRADIETTLGVTEHALAILVGQFPREAEIGSLDRLPAPIAQPAIAVPATLLFQRPDVRAAHQRLLAVDAQVGAALAAHFPSVSLSATLGERLDVNPASLVWTLLANLTAPLFQGGQIQAQYAERRAQLREALAGFKQLLLVAVKEVEDALLRGHALVERIEHLEQLVTASEGALRLSIEQYVQGLSGYLNVLNAQQTLLSSQLELIAARRELISARISLARAIGGSWMDREIRAQDQRTAKES